ncbi:MAG: methionyl-tRNA formyltransferase [Candidatus Omnitrophica bacterium]|nr:methionyl-tRNA formyltransferase [Candidatus Omnitrophota bacterium]
MKIVFFGTGSFGILSLEVLLHSSHSLVGVVTTPDKPKGRHLHLEPSPVKEWAVRNRLPVFDFSKEAPERCLAQLRDKDADLFVVASFGVILPEEALLLPRRMTINLHPSLLPRYRGPSPICWALLHGDSETGVSLMKVIGKVDAGDVLLQETVSIDPQDDIFTLEDKLSAAGGRLLLLGLRMIEEGRISLTPQDEAKAGYSRKLTKEDGRILWDRPAEELHRRVRALKRWPGCYFFCGGARLIVTQAQVSESGEGASGAPGTVVFASFKEGMGVMTAKDVLVIRQIQREGKKSLPAGEFLKGFPIRAGSVLQ